MAENVLETRIQLRYGTYSEWMNSNVILKKGEAAVAIFPQEGQPVGIKIGDGFHLFYELPWLQGLAADVYSWAKLSTKPTYTATEISGLDAYIRDNFHISGDVTFAPRIYQLVQDTNNSNLY